MEYLLQNLENRIAWCGSALEAMGALGDFVEEMHEALKRALNFDDKVVVAEWSGELSKIDANIHAAQYSIFREVYHKRNLAKHPNPANLTKDEVANYFKLINPRTQELVCLLAGKNLLDRGRQQDGTWRRTHPKERSRLTALGFGRGLFCV